MINYISINSKESNEELILDLREERRYINLVFYHPLWIVKTYLELFFIRFKHNIYNFSFKTGDTGICKFGFDSGISYEFGLENGRVFHELLMNGKDKYLAYYNAEEHSSSALLECQDIKELLQYQSSLTILSHSSDMIFSNGFLKYLSKWFNILGINSNILGIVDNNSNLLSIEWDPDIKQCVKILWLIYKTMEFPNLIVIPEITKYLDQKEIDNLYIIFEYFCRSKVISCCTL